MSRCTLIPLGLIFALLVGVYFATQHTREAGVKSILTTLGKQDWLSAKEIKVFFNEEKGFSLVKEKDSWVIRNGLVKPASSVLVEEFLKELSGLFGEERAKGEKYFSRFKVSEKEALHIVLLRDGEELAHLLVGKRGPQWQSSFVRLASQEAIYLVPVNLLAKFDIWSVEPGPPKDKEFVDLQVLNVPEAKLKRLAFDSPKVKWELLRREKDFLLHFGDKEKVLSKEEVVKYLRKLFPLYAEKIVSPEKFSEKRATLTFVSRLGREVKVDFGPCQKEKDQEVCLLKKGPFVYRVGRSVIRDFFELKN
jgi:hypothetical protein